MTLEFYIYLIIIGLQLVLCGILLIKERVDHLFKSRKKQHIHTHTHRLKNIE